MTNGESMFPALAVLFLIAACGQEQAPIADPATDGPAVAARSCSRTRNWRATC
jgi:hypothetical protein